MSKPVRLAKKEPKTNDVYSFFNNLTDIVEAWALSHALLCLIVLTSLLMALFVTVIFLMIGVSAVESGAMRNFVNGGLI
jgi:hypothetical protein